MSFLNINDFKQKLYNYIEARLELVKLETEERIGRASALIIQLVLLALLLGSMLLFLNIALALYINTFSFCKGAPYLGFLIVAGTHFGLILLVIFLQGTLLKNTKKFVFVIFHRFVKYVTKNRF
jgi:hypothetical protein